MKWLRKHALLATILIFISGYTLFSLMYVANEKHTNPQNSSATTSVSTPEAITPNSLYVSLEEARIKSGATGLTHNPALDTSAGQKCSDMVSGDYYAHVNPTTGKHGYDYITANLSNTVYVDEILNQGTVTTTQGFVDSWMSSPDHKSAIIDPKYTDIGFAVCNEGGKTTVVGHLAQVKIPQQTVQAQAQRSFVHCSSYEIYGTVHTNCY